MDEYPFAVGDRVETVTDITSDYSLPKGSVGTIREIDWSYMPGTVTRKDVYPITVEMDVEFINDGSLSTVGYFHPDELAVIGKDNDEALTEIDFGAILAAM